MRIATYVERTAQHRSPAILCEVAVAVTLFLTVPLIFVSSFGLGGGATSGGLIEQLGGKADVVASRVYGPLGSFETDIVGLARADREPG